jgi:hypothetical protein
LTRQGQESIANTYIKFPQASERVECGEFVCSQVQILGPSPLRNSPSLAFVPNGVPNYMPLYVPFGMSDVQKARKFGQQGPHEDVQSTLVN